MSNNPIFQNINDYEKLDVTREKCIKWTSHQIMHMENYKNGVKDNPRYILQGMDTVTLEENINIINILREKLRFEDQDGKRVVSNTIEELHDIYSYIQETSIENIYDPFRAKLMKQILRIAQQKMIQEEQGRENVYKPIQPKNTPLKNLKDKVYDAMEPDRTFIGQARACSWYATTSETANHLITNSTLGIATLGISVVVGLLLKAGFKRKTYEKKRETTRLFLQRFTGKKLEEILKLDEPKRQRLKVNYFSANTVDQINAVFDNEPEFVPDKKFFYQFKKDSYYYVWQALAQITGLQWLKPRIEQYHDSIDNAHKILLETQKTIEEVLREKKLDNAHLSLHYDHRGNFSESKKDEDNQSVERNHSELDNRTNKKHVSLLEESVMTSLLQRGDHNDPDNP